MADRGCNLECVKYDKGEDKAIEFVGPVKIILIDQPKSAYICKTCYAAAIVMAQMMMATTTTLVMFFSLSYNKNAWFKALHILLCTVGLQLILPSGILSLNNLSGSSASMKISDRKFEHVFLQYFGLACGVSGAIISFFSGFSCFFTLHSCLGIAAIILSISCALTGLCFYEFRGESLPPEEFGVFKRFIYNIHQFLGTLAMTLSSACFVCGIIKTSFIKWLPLKDMFYYIIIYCVFYTFIIIYKPLKNVL